MPLESTSAYEMIVVKINSKESTLETKLDGAE
jgi:hypothetical protein